MYSYDQYIRYLMDQDFEFLAYIDSNINKKYICINRHDERISQLKFSDKDQFESIDVIFTNYDTLVNNILENFIFTDQFRYVRCHRGNHKIPDPKEDIQQYKEKDPEFY